MFTSCENKGLQMTFENGLTISIQFGVGNYCERRSFTASFQSEMSEPIICSKTAEIAIWDGVNNEYNFGSDVEFGWVSTDDVADWIYRVKNATSLETI